MSLSTIAAARQNEINASMAVVATSTRCVRAPVSVGSGCLEVWLSIPCLPWHRTRHTPATGRGIVSAFEPESLRRAIALNGLPAHPARPEA